MDWFLKVDCKSAFVPETGLLEIVLRGTLVYLALYTLLRVVLKRQRGAVGVTDLLVLVLIADAAQNAMADDYTSGTRRGAPAGRDDHQLSAALDWLGYHFPLVQRLIRAAPPTLVENGRMLKHNMARSDFTEEELMSQLRLQALADLKQVDCVRMEIDGLISVIRKDGERSSHHRREAF